MTVLHETSTLNVESSLSDYFVTALTALTRPTWLSAMPTIIHNMPEGVAAFPSFSFWHIPAGIVEQYMGRIAERGVKASRKLGILEISCWVNRKQTNWMSQLRTMQSMVETAHQDSGGGVIIKDYQSNQSMPNNTVYRVTLIDLDIVNVAKDPNPDVERRRCLVNYTWNMRSSN